MSNSFPNLTKTKEYIYQWTENKITATFPQIEYINDKIFIEFEKVGHTDIYMKKSSKSLCLFFIQKDYFTYFTTNVNDE